MGSAIDRYYQLILEKIEQDHYPSKQMLDRIRGLALVE